MISKCVCGVTCDPSTMADLKEYRMCITFCFNLEKTGSKTYELLKKALVIMTCVKPKPLKGIQVSKVAELQLRIWNIQVIITEIN